MARAGEQAPAEEAALLMFCDPRVVHGLMAFWALVVFLAWAVRGE